MSIVAGTFDLTRSQRSATPRTHSQSGGTAGPSVGSTSDLLSSLGGTAAPPGYARLVNSHDPKPRTNTNDRGQLRCGV
jgi:hypothetical protein